MKRLILVSCSVLACLASASCVWGLASTHPNDQAVAGQPDWPEGLKELINSPGRVGGYFVNACDYFYFAGDAEALNAFLDKLAALKGEPATVVLREGRGFAAEPWDAVARKLLVAADWKLSILRRGWSMDAPGADEKDKPGYVLIVDVWTGGKVDAARVKAPAGLALRYGAKLTLTIRCAAAEIKAGDEIPVEFTITNEGKSPYDYMDRNFDRSGRMAEYRLDAIDADGRPVSDPRAKYTGAIGGGEVGQRKLAPGASFTKTIALNDWALLTAPGRYTVTGTYRLEGFSLDRGTTVASEPITITVAPRTPAETGAYIEALARELSAAEGEPAKAVVIRKLMYTCDRRIVPILIESMYGISSGFWEGEAFSYYLDFADAAEIKRPVMESALKRGLGKGMLYILTRAGVTADEMRPLIERSLVADNPGCWQPGALAAQFYPDPRFVPRLIAIAQTGDPIARETAMHSLARERTDEGVAALRRLLDDPDENVRRMASDVVRNAYGMRGHGLKNPLRDDDFPAEYRTAK